VKILFLCHRLPYPPDKGDKIRAFYQLRAMATRHEVDVFTLIDDRRDLKYRRALEAHCHQLTVARVIPELARLRSLPYLFSRTPLTIPYFFSSELQKHVGGAVSRRNYDRIYVYSSSMAQYVPWGVPGQSTPPHSNTGIPVVMDLVDVDSDKWKQYASATRFPFSTIFQREGQHLRAYERTVCEKAACVLVSTGREAALAKQIAPAARIHIVQNGVDTVHFAPAERSASSRALTIVFTGDMSYFPNQEAVVFFAREVLPLIRRELAHVRFLVVGRNPTRAVQRLQSIECVTVIGSVPDVRPWLANASVAVAPLTIAAGIQNKILEAMATGLPVVATPRAVQGLRSDVAELVETGDGAEELARRVVCLLRDPLRARLNGLEGRRRVIASYSWDTALQRLLDLIEDPRQEAGENEASPFQASA
jgi:sugar transferase (PEP-CTERM/EpsH1 system associated)